MDRETQRQLDALGCRRLDPGEQTAARMRIAQRPVITRQFELGRLRVFLTTLRNFEMMSECHKAIAQFSLAAEEGDWP